MDDSPQEILKSVALLVDEWCNRRCLQALRFILPGYPLRSGLTDDWADLLKSLEDVRAFAIDELTELEKDSVGRLIGSISSIITNKP